MSERAKHDERHHAPPQQEEDLLPTGKISLMLIALLVGMIVCIIYGTLLYEDTGEELAARPIPRQEVVARPSGVDTTLFQAGPAWSARFTGRQQEVLRSYGWVDAQKGIARIPIDRAIDLTVDRGATR
jgi:hypothetical protein